MKAVLSRLGAGMLALFMLFFGAIYGFGGRDLLREWSAISLALRGCAVLLLLCGIAMVACAVWLLATLGRNARPLWIGGVMTTLCGGVLLAGVLANVIPCTSPT